MNDYRIELVDQYGNRQHDHTWADSAQSAADEIRKTWKNCHITRICVAVHDWK